MHPILVRQPGGGLPRYPCTVERMQKDSRELDTPLRLTIADAPFQSSVRANDGIQRGER